MRGRNILYTRRGGQNFCIHGVTKMFGSGNNDVDGETEEDVNEANILVNKASKLSKGARFQIHRFS